MLVIPRKLSTWCNNRRRQHRIWERLDQALYNLEFQEQYPSTMAIHLVRTTSDHSPLLIKFEKAAPKASAGFIFQRMWVDHPDFLQLVSTNLARLAYGSLGKIFYRKLRRL